MFDHLAVAADVESARSMPDGQDVIASSDTEHGPTDLLVFAGGGLFVVGEAVRVGDELLEPAADEAEDQRFPEPPVRQPLL